MQEISYPLDEVPIGTPVEIGDRIRVLQIRRFPTPYFRDPFELAYELGEHFRLGLADNGFHAVIEIEDAGFDGPAHFDIYVILVARIIGFDSDEVKQRVLESGWGHVTAIVLFVAATLMLGFVVFSGPTFIKTYEASPETQNTINSGIVAVVVVAIIALFIWKG